MASLEKWQRMKEAYRKMAEMGYRPAAPSDGFGNITVPERELVLDIEGREYGQRFLQEEDKGVYWAGCTDFRSLCAAIWALEAFRLMNAGSFGGETIVSRLLRMAAEEYEREMALSSGEAGV
ncbi:MAG: hypothetical protein HY664_08740 [Chloroflexi bacterium]|nr:hypothetical protein [Chloroflexota bacterium]